MAGNQTIPIDNIDEMTVNDDNKRAAGVAISASCLIICWLAVAVRFLARRYAVKARKFEDGLVVITLLLGTVFMIDTGILFGTSAEQHMELLLDDTESVDKYNQSVLANDALCFISLMMVKLCVATLLSTTSASVLLRKILWAIESLVVLYTMILVIALLTQCVSLEVIPEVLAPTSYLDVTMTLTIFAALDVLVNLAIFCLAILAVRSLDVILLSRVQLSLLFSFGTFTIGASIGRSVCVGRISTDDSIWARTDSSIWASVELTLAILCACLPRYRPLLNRNLQKRKSRILTMNDPRQWFGRTSEKPPLVCNTEAARSTIHVETTIENSWDEHYPVSQSPIPTHLWDADELQGCSSRPALSRAGSSRFISPCHSQIWTGTSRPVSQKPSRSGSTKKSFVYHMTSSEEDDFFF